MRKDRMVFILTSHDEMPIKGSTGFYIDEAAHPWKIFTEAGYTVDFASVKGGKAPQDGRNPEDAEQNAFLSNPKVAEQLANTKVVSMINPDDYKVVLYVGGHGTMFDFPQDTAIADFSARVYENGGIVAAVCHGPAGLVNIKLSDGTYLVDGKRLTSFTNNEEQAVGLTEAVPFLLQTQLEDRGADFIAGDNFSENVVIDGRLVTGQNPQSAKAVAHALLDTLNGITD
ncbi:type 1 glutamine amidotransferase domain-containing protein [Corynebacterium durum]|uniref:type 1 glutamine amidotransferase domain-containing protein n=1 Tax=Corynebacterium durum TaxID=61592 RepID=UPI0028E87584|nr:type 1 glutamine amidotransferase domain-containing protein [Corynebacterium durum]